MLTACGQHFLAGEPRHFLLDDGHIQAIEGPINGKKVVDGEDHRVAPGLIDIQVNGSKGHAK